MNGYTINKDNTLCFDVEDWHCTDPDNVQFCRKVNDTTFQYIQYKRPETLPHNKFALEVLNNKTLLGDWWEDTIDVTDYDESEINDVLSAYGGILDNVTNEVDRNQLIAECIFETYMFDF